jgi:hypothetical protein
MARKANGGVHATGDDRVLAGLRDLERYTAVTAIVGDILKIRAHDVGLGDMAIVEMPDGQAIVRI